MNSKATPILIGNPYVEETHGGYGGDVFHQNGICRTLNASIGGAGQTLVMIEEPKMITRQRTEEAKQQRKLNGDRGAKFSKDKEYTLREDGASNTITTVQKDNLVAEPRVQSIGNRNPSGRGIGGEVYDTNGLSPTICVNKGSGYTVAEPRMVKCATAKGYAECPAGGGFDAAFPNSTLRRGRVQDNGDVVGAITASGDGHCYYEGMLKNNDTNQTAKDMKKRKPTYRIRKLTPRECFRLMDVDDTDIDKLVNSKDEKGEPSLSKTQLYKLAGNSIVVACLHGIFRELFFPTERDCSPKQLRLF